MRRRVAPGQLFAVRASIESLVDSTTVTGVESVLLNVSGTETLPPLPTAMESKPHCNNAGGVGTTATLTESLKPSTESTTNVTPSATPVTMPVASTVATAGSTVRYPNVL